MAAAAGAGAGSTRSVKLTYFNAKGRGQAIRNILAAGGVDFEDHRFASRDEFIALKPTLPFNQVPILEVDGEVFSQSQGLARLAGRLGGLYPEDALEAARVDMITEAVVDLSNGFAKIKYNPALSDEEKAAAFAKYTAETLPGWIKNVEARIKGDGPFFAGDKISVADISVFSLFDLLKDSGADVLTAESAPRLSKLVAAVGANEGIAAQLAK